MTTYEPVTVIPLPIQEMVRRLEARGSEFKNGKWSCPAHDDPNPSLSVREMGDHSVRVKCFADCDEEDVLDALDLVPEDLDPPKPSWTTTATHVYERADGTPLARKVRKEDRRGLQGKRFIVQHHDGRRWVTGGADEKVLYCLAEVRRVAKAGGTVVVMEGEKAADAFNIRERRPGDMVATTAIDGASGRWLDSYTADLDGAAKVILVPDRDSSGKGYSYMLRVCRQLKAAGLKVFFRQSATTGDKDDAYDHFKAGHAFGKMERLTLGEVGRLAGAEAASKAVDAPTGPTYESNDVGRAERLRDLFGDNLRHVPDEGWRAFNGTSWTRGSTAAAIANARVHAVAAAIREEADAARKSGGEADLKRAKALADEARQVGNNRAINAALAQAALMPELMASRSSFDADPFVLACLSGTIDLTGDGPVLREHRHEDYASALVPRRYEEGARSELWERFKATSFPDAEVRAFALRLLGHALLGYNREQVATFLHGGTGSGKSTLLEVVAATLGPELAGSFGVSLFAADRTPGGHRQDIVDVLSRRFIYSTEFAASGGLISAEQLKRIVGGDTLAPRGSYAKEHLHALPAFAPFVSINPDRMPTIKGADDALRRRVVAVPLDARPDAEDKSLRFRFGPADYDAVFTDLVDGYAAYARHGLGAPPEAVERTTAALWGRMSPVDGFIDQRCVVGDGLRELHDALYDEYVEWCAEDPQRGFPMPVTAFGLRLTEMGFAKHRLNTRDKKSKLTWRLGIGLKGSLQLVNGDSA